MTARVAAIDCGTNSVRLLVADVDGDRLVDVERRMEIVRLGQDVDRTGRLAPEALARTFAALASYAEDIHRHGAGAVRMVATSATRDAANRSEFVAGVLDVLGVTPEVVTGDEEAALSFLGATRDLPAAGRHAAPYLVVDIGGGSTEFVLGSRTAQVARSVDIGCVRLTERHLHSDPPTRSQVNAVVADVEAALDVVAGTVALESARTLVGLAGSVTTVAAIALGLERYDAERTHHACLTADQVHEVAARLAAMTHAERADMPVIHPGRVDVIVAGALVLDRIVRRGAFAEVLVSEHDILDGVALSIAE